MAATMYPSSSTLSFLGVVFQTGARVLGPMGLIIVSRALGSRFDLPRNFGFYAGLGHIHSSASGRRLKPVRFGASPVRSPPTSPPRIGETTHGNSAVPVAVDLLHHPLNTARPPLSTFEAGETPCCSPIGSVNPAGQGPEKSLGTRTSMTWPFAASACGRAVLSFLLLLNFISFWAHFALGRCAPARRAGPVGHSEGAGPSVLKTKGGFCSPVWINLSYI